MFKKAVISCVAVAVLGSGFSTAIFADDSNKVPPIHWAANPFNNASDTFTSGKSFCGKKYIGKKTCIPAMNKTADTLTISTTSYDSSNAPSGDVVTLMGKGSLPSTVFTVADTDASGRTTTVYSGPANNREGIICSTDSTSHATACKAWK